MVEEVACEESSEVLTGELPEETEETDREATEEIEKLINQKRKRLST